MKICYNNIKFNIKNWGGGGLQPQNSPWVAGCTTAYIYMGVDFEYYYKS